MFLSLFFPPAKRGQEISSQCDIEKHEEKCLNAQNTGIHTQFALTRIHRQAHIHTHTKTNRHTHAPFFFPPVHSGWNVKPELDASPSCCQSGLLFARAGSYSLCSRTDHPTRLTTSPLRQASSGTRTPPPPQPHFILKWPADKIIDSDKVSDTYPYLNDTAVSICSNQTLWIAANSKTHLTSGELTPSPCN